MKGPISPDIYDTERHPNSWWRASAPEWQAPAPLDGAVETDVAIIGGGYAGLSVALRLAERGVEALVLDAGEVGWGASGRNGGIVGLTSHKLSDGALAARHGQAEVARYRAAMLAGIDRLRAFCARSGLAEICQGDGEAVFAHSPRAFRALEAAAAQPQPGIELSPIPPADTGDMARFGGVRISPGFGVHPLRLVRALADAAVASGQRVAPLTEVTRWRQDEDGHLLETPRGAIRAARVVVATNGFTPDGLHPHLRGRAFPVISNIAVTRVLTAEERARHPWLGDDPVADTRNLLVYLRMLPEGRLLFGMRGDLTGADRHAEGMRTHVARRLAECFPGWAGVEIEYFWRGPICATTSFTPAVGVLQSDGTAFHAFGWHGSGVNGAQVAGRLLADVIAGAPIETIPGPFRGAAKRMPFAALRPWYVGAVMWQQRLEDALG